MGLAEGMFPTLQSEDPLYSDRERIAFEQFHNNKYDLQTISERQDDTAVFYECMALARSTLTLTRPTLDESANQWPPSVLWSMVCDVVEAPRMIRYLAGQPQH